MNEYSDIIYVPHAKRPNRPQLPINTWYRRHYDDIIELYNYFCQKIDFKCPLENFVIYLYNTSY